jgi:hypothetical protein
MPASDSLFCFTSNKIDSNFCPNCRAPMLVRVGQDLSARTFECFNCDKVVVIPADRSVAGAGILDLPTAHPK